MGCDTAMCPCTSAFVCVLECVCGACLCVMCPISCSLNWIKIVAAWIESKLLQLKLSQICCSLDWVPSHATMWDLHAKRRSWDLCFKCTSGELMRWSSVPFRVGGNNPADMGDILGCPSSFLIHFQTFVVMPTFINNHVEFGLCSRSRAPSRIWFEAKLSGLYIHTCLEICCKHYIHPHLLMWHVFRCRAQSGLHGTSVPLSLTRHALSAAAKTCITLTFKSEPLATIAESLRQSVVWLLFGGSRKPSRGYDYFRGAWQKRYVDLINFGGHPWDTRETLYYTLWDTREILYYIFFTTLETLWDTRETLLRHSELLWDTRETLVQP